MQNFRPGLSNSNYYPIRPEENAEYVVRRGAPSTCFQLVVSGEIESSVTYASGHRHLFSFLRQGDCTGIVFLMDGGNHLLDHIARVPTTLLAIPNQVILKEMQAQPSLRLALLRQLALRTQIKYSRLTLDRSVPLPTWLAGALQTPAGLYGLPRGDRIVARYEAIARRHRRLAVRQPSAPEFHLKQFEKIGVISLGRSSVTILDSGRLSQLAPG